MKRFPLNDILLLLALSVLLFILNLWGYPLFDVDEPRYAETAREMLTSPGDWITPHFNWVTRFDKPVLFYWLIAGSYKLFGVSEFSARLVSALAATAILLMLYGGMRHALNRRAGLITALVFATMPQVFALARWLVTDMTLACFMTGTWLGLFWALTRSPRWFWVAGAFAGLGMLTKGPVALALPGLTFLIFLALYARSQWRILLSPWMWTGLALSLGIALPWYWAVAQANPGEFMDKFFLLHNVDRFTQTVSGHSGPWYYYVPIIFGGSFPWSLFLPGLILAWWQRRSHLPALLQYANMWFWVVLLFFSVSGTKLLTYVLPGLPALAILMGWYWHQRIEPAQASALKEPRAIHYGLWIMSGLLISALWVSMTQPYRFIPPELQDLYSPVRVQVALALLITTFLLAAWWNWRAQLSRAFIALSGGLVITFLYGNFFILPLFCQIFQSDVVAFARRAVQDSATLATYRTKKPSLVFYSRQKVYYVDDKTPIGHAVSQRPSKIKILHVRPQPLYLVVKNKHLADLQRVHSIAMIQAGHVYSLIQIPTLPIIEDINQ